MPIRFKCQMDNGLEECDSCKYSDKGAKEEPCITCINRFEAHPCPIVDEYEKIGNCKYCKWEEREDSE